MQGSAVFGRLGLEVHSPYEPRSMLSPNDGGSEYQTDWRFVMDL